MRDQNVRFNVIAVDFANEIGQEEDDEDIEDKENEK